MNLFKKNIKEPKPNQYPDFNNVKEWMVNYSEYFISIYPENASDLFNPSSGDYIPIKIVAGTSEKVFNELLSDYRNLKSQYPLLVDDAKKKFNINSYSSVGDKEDFPKN